MAFRSGQRAGQRAWFVLSGLVSVVFAVALFIRPDLGAVSLAIVFGLYSIFYGITALVVRSEGRSLEENIQRFAPQSLERPTRSLSQRPSSPDDGL